MSTRSLLALTIATLSVCANAAQGEMGTGIPVSTGVYGAAHGNETIVWALNSATQGMPCGYIKLSTTTLGMDGYKIAVAVVMTAQVAGKRVRFYAHVARDLGCGADMVQLLD